MGGYDDDRRDDEERYRNVDDDIDDEDDDDPSSRLGNRPRPNPFAGSSPGSGLGGLRSGLPGASSGASSYASRFGDSGSSAPGGGGLSSRLGSPGQPSGGGSGSAPRAGSAPPTGGSGSRLPGSVGPNRDTGEQPATSRFGGGSRDTGEQASTSRFSPSNPPGSSFGNRPSSSGSGSRDTGEQPSTSRFSPNNPPSREAGEKPSSSSFGSGGSGSFGGNRPSSPGSPIRSNDPNAPGASGGSSINRSDLGSRLGAGGSNPPSTSGGFGSLRSPGPSEAEKKFGEKKDASSPSVKTPSAKPNDKKPDAKKDEPAGEGLGARLGGLAGGLTSRFGGGDKKDDPKKPDAKKDTPSSDGGLGARLGGLAGVLTSRVGGGDKKDDPKKPDAGGLGARLGGLAGGLTSRFGGGDKKDDAKKPDDKGKPAGSAPAGGSAYGTSRFGGGTSGPTPTSSSPSARPSSPSSPFGGAGAKQSPLGGAKGAAAQPTKPEVGKAGGGLGARFSAFTSSLPLIGKRDKAPKKQRSSKVPEVKKSEGMSLDTKLDILGVVLVFSAMIIFFSALSPNQGQVTGQLNEWFGRIFGWGALAVPLGILAVGGWLIMRHFGDKAPEVDPLRVIGVLMLYIGLLVIFQFVESFNYTGDRAVGSLAQLEMQVEVTYNAYRAGGGWVGGQIYLFLVGNITEVGAFFTVVGWMFIGFMLFADLSASEVAIVIISIWRSFSDSVKRQRQRRRARIADLQAKRAAAAAAAALAAPAPPAIAVTKPIPSELPAAVPSSALPSPAGAPVAMPMPPLSQPEERSIPMRLGGRSEMLKVDTAGRPSTAPAAANTPAEAPTATTPEKKDEGETGGIATRLRGAMPFGAKNTTETPAVSPAPAAAKSSAASSLAGRLFGSRSAEPSSEKPVPAAATPTADKASPAGSLANRLFNRPSADKPAPSPTPPVPQPAAASISTSPISKPAAEQPAARLGDLLRPSTPEQPDSEAASGAPVTASPSSSFSPFSRPSPSTSGTTLPFPRPQDDDEEMDEEDESVLDMSPARPKGIGVAPRPSNPFGVGAASPVEQKPADAEAPKPAASITDRMDRLNALRAGITAPTTTPIPRSTDMDKPSEPSAKPSEESQAPAASQPGGIGARIRPFNFGEQSDKPAATVSTALVSSAAAAPKESDEKKPPVFTPAGTPAVTAAPKISIPLGHPDTPPAPPPAVAPSVPAGNLLGAAQIKRPRREWKLPDYRTLLATGSDQDFDRAFLTQRARIIEDTLQSFGAPGKVVEINTGPVITQFGVEPDYLMSRSGKKNRIKVSAIAALDKDLQLALGAKAIRIEAPVPGKGFVGVEVPNDESALVSLRDVMDSDEFKKIDSPLTIALGQSVDGTPVAADLTAMPHLLIAGTTGSGKSVCVNAIISSLVLLNSPERVKFIMVDPKRVELTGYNGIPHLIAPVVVELERIVGVLKWVTREMDERYKKFSAAGARNIEDYNKHLPTDAEIMPYIIVIIDELADLMMLAPDETERVITRIAALARATGIHLVIATQRPSVDVVTGLIKANFPARIAFAVAGSVDSRVILDQPGAERLLGRGDMLYMSGDSPAPVRLQGVFVSDIEINNIVRYWKQQGEEGGATPVPQLVLDKTLATESLSAPRMGTIPPPAPKPVAQQQAFWDRAKQAANDDDEDGYEDEVEDADGDGEDDMYDEAVDLVRKLNKASVSLLQRRLRIGYTRAARLIDLMEERGVVGPSESGSKPRDVIPLRE